MTNINFDYNWQHFYLTNDNLIIPEYPLTVTLQITRKCNISCIYCSESEFIPDPSTENLEKIIENMNGVSRVIISGGEPTLRKDLVHILECCNNTFDIVAMACNAVNIDSKLIQDISKYVNYLDVTIDGPRNIHNGIRGSYDKIMQSLWNLKKEGIDFSIVMVLLEENKDYISYVAQIADVLGAKKLKILSPIPKGRGKNILSKRLSSKKIRELFDDLKKMKETLGWNVRITLTDWEYIDEGHALLIHPNGDVVASPVWSKESCIDYVGNILEDNIKNIWDVYQYKNNHVKKYVEKTLLVC